MGGLLYALFPSESRRSREFERMQRRAIAGGEGQRSRKSAPARSGRGCLPHTPHATGISEQSLVKPPPPSRDSDRLLTHALGSHWLVPLRTRANGSTWLSRCRRSSSALTCCTRRPKCARRRQSRLSSIVVSHARACRNCHRVRKSEAPQSHSESRRGKIHCGSPAVLGGWPFDPRVPSE